MQAAAVEAGLFSGNNLLIVAPTSTGKTLVGELAALQHAVARNGTVFVTSHKALAYEKYLTFRDSYSREESFHFATGIATGDEVTDEGALDDVPFTVATYEKWYYTLIDRPQLLKRRSLLVVDEIQMIGDRHRGDRLEALITWVRMKSPGTQIIGLSATIPNAEKLAGWLEAALVNVGGRPVPLVEEVWTVTETLAVDRDNAPKIKAYGGQEALPHNSHCGWGN